MTSHRVGRAAWSVASQTWLRRIRIDGHCMRAHQARDIL